MGGGGTKLRSGKEYTWDGALLRWWCTDGPSSSLYRKWHFKKKRKKIPINSPRGPLFFHYFYRYRYMYIQIDRWIILTWVWPGLELCSSYSWLSQLHVHFHSPPSPPVYDTFLHAVNLGHWPLANNTGLMPVSERTIVHTPVSPHRDSNRRPHHWH